MSAEPTRRPPAALHVDLDGGEDIFRVHGWRWTLEGDPLFRSGLEGALDFFDAEGVKATFFVIARDLEDPGKRDLLEEIVRRGHELGSHTISHRHLPKLAPDEKRREVALSRERIASELGAPVDGFRAPGFEIDRESLELVAEAGYRYDSSLFPTSDFARRVGLPEVPDRPCQILGGELVELPMPGHAPLPVPFHPSYSLVLGTPYFRLGLSRFARRRVPMVMLFHLTDFAEPLPKHALPGFKARLFTISHRSRATKHARCADMLGAIRARFEIGPTAAMLAARRLG